VDPEALNLVNYFQVVKNPMDLGTVKKKLASKGYRHAQDFIADVTLTFDNAMLYNPKGDEEHELAKKLKMFFLKEWDAVFGDLGTP
ncbi:Bromodomain-containing protein, partial [Baffinella frigidus]